MKPEHFDNIIIGAGLSGIGVAHYLQKNCPQKTLAILEGRNAIGGTWDLFRYPGIRSDSDMFTYGYHFKPWTDRDSLASGDKILNYLTETIKEDQLADKIRLSHRVKKMNWNSEVALWELEVEVNGQSKHFTSHFTICCSGYFDYQQGYQPAYNHQKDFKGELVHPQNWPESLDYKNKKVIVIGSGATAVTLVPSMAKQALQVTMLQRSPTYIASAPMQDWFLKLMFLLLPEKWASRIVRKRNIIRSNFYYRYMTRKPEKAKKKIARKQDKLLSPSIDRKHFRPRYNPWDQRFCLIPDGDLFDALNEGKAEIKTDTINRFTEKGILLGSGEQLEADIIVSATGLNVKILSDIDLTLDGEKVSLGEKMFYRGVLLEDMPNLGFVFGYTNASWTLKVELVSQYISRVVNYMDKNNLSVCIPVNVHQVKSELFLNLTSGYIQRAQEQIPKQGSEQPWRLDQNYNKDKVQLNGVKIDDGVLKFSRG